MEKILTFKHWGKHWGCFKTLTVFTIVLLTLISQSSIAQTLPSFDKDFWQGEKESASGKVKRGIGLTVLGAGTFVPAAVLIKKSIDNPSRYTGWSAVISIAAIGMTAHGVGSILFGTKQKKEADNFITSFNDNSPDYEKQKEAYLYNSRKSAVKLTLFGSVLSLQGILLLTNGTVLSVRKNKSRDIGGATIWPSFVTGGVLLALGSAVMVMSIKRYKSYKSLNSAPIQISSKISFSPYLNVDEKGSVNTGLFSTVIF